LVCKHIKTGFFSVFIKHAFITKVLTLLKGFSEYKRLKDENNIRGVIFFTPEMASANDYSDYQLPVICNCRSDFFIIVHKNA
jgi:hypothetical protein